MAGHCPATLASTSPDISLTGLDHHSPINCSCRTISDVTFCRLLFNHYMSIDDLATTDEWRQLTMATTENDQQGG